MKCGVSGVSPQVRVGLPLEYKYGLEKLFYENGQFGTQCLLTLHNMHFVCSPLYM